MAQAIPSAASESERDGRLRKHDRTRLLELRERGDRDAVLLIATRMGTSTTAAVTARLTALGAHVEYRADMVGYLRARVPTNAVEQVAEWHDVEAVNIDGSQFYFAAEIDGTTYTAPPVRTIPFAVPPPGPATPAANPYLPTQDIGAPQFVRAHPTFDGRGVTIAVIECCTEFFHPALQWARTLTGDSIRKVHAIYATGNPERHMWFVATPDTVLVADGRFTDSGTTYTAPHDGRYRFGVTADRYTQGFWAKVPRHPRIAVLWDDATDSVWVDTNGDQSFTDESAMLPYNIRGDAVRLRWPDSTLKANYVGSLAVALDRERRGVHLMMASPHTAMVAGVASGTQMFRSAATGVAPGAGLVLIEPGLSQGGWIEAYLLAATLPDVDVITAEASYLVRLHDGRTVWSIIADRVVDVYRRPIFQSAGNFGPGMGSANEAGGGSRTMLAGGYISRATWRSNFGLLAPRADYVGYFASRGPGAGGGFIPRLITPMCAVTSSTMRSPTAPGDTNRADQSDTPLYVVPPGYGVGCGTSFAAPMAAGAAALLISAAKQSGVAYDADRVRWALSAAARYLPGFQAYEQGAGLLDVGAAWTRLQTAPPAVRIVGTAPVHTALSGDLRVPDEGTGLFENEGWHVGDRGVRQVMLTRQSGRPDSTAYTVQLLGDDGTFSTPSRMELPLDHPVALPVTVHPLTAGAHTAVLRLVQPDGVTPAYETLCTVVVPEELTANNGYHIVHPVTVPWMDQAQYFVQVPAGAAALNVTLDVTHGPARMRIHDPSGGKYPTMFNALFTPPTLVTGQTAWAAGGVVRRSIADPEPGVWEIVIEHNGYDRVKERLIHPSPAIVTFTAGVSALRGDGVARQTVRTGDRARARQTSRVWITNTMGPIRGRAKGALGSASSDELALTADAPIVEHDVVIDAGATRFIASITGATDSGADVDLHVFDCTSGTCQRRESVVSHSDAKTIRVDHPAPGRWRAVVSANTIPHGKVLLRYSDVVVHPKYGSVAITDTTARREPGSRWPVILLVTPGMAPRPGRFYEAIVDVVDPQGQAPTGPSQPPSGAAAHTVPLCFGTFVLDLRHRRVSP